ncbi:MAG: hypothetical protein D6679_02115 [Candidatus Hydrogenedentota bacterium]|nr:MAG: hypothetical protein D6679_02115 [Candidatus Hydrogenedentota bacterium]
MSVVRRAFWPNKKGLEDPGLTASLLYGFSVKLNSGIVWQKAPIFRCTDWKEYCRVEQGSVGCVSFFLGR